MSKYWEARQEKREVKSFEKGTEVYKEYVRTLEQAKENINAKIAKLYAKHSKDTGLAKAESMKIIQGKEYREWRYKIEDYVKQLNSIKDKDSIEFKKLSLELETLASRSRINRLESLKADIDMELIKAGAKANNTMTNALTKTYADTYKSLIDDLNYKSTVDMDRMKKVIGYDWSGANYSKRIWGNTESLAKTIKNEVFVGLNQGINYKTMSTRIANKFETSKKNAERLVRTEINYIHNQATVDGYKDAGIEKYQFLATLDSRTSDTCASLNGEVFEVKNIAVGINYPPMHPRCRSTTVPIIDYDSLQNIKEEDLKDNEKNSIINIEVDEMTPCLRRLKDNVIVKTEVKEIKYRKSDFKDWLFDWSKTEKKGYQILALYADGDDRIQGAISIKPQKDNLTVEIDIAESAPFNSSYNKKIKGKEYNGVGAHLFAEVCKRSFDLGYDGYVEFIAKTNLVNYYKEKLNAIPIDSQRMYINTDGAKRLVEKYYGGGEI